MARLEDLTVGAVVEGIVPSEPVTVVSTQWYGTAGVDVFYKTHQGHTGSQLVYREDEPNLKILEKSLPWSFDVPGEKLKLVSEAYRINLAHLFDPYLAVHTSSIEPLPHQISAVYEEMLPRLPLRYVLADDPGAGKTIMTGLLLKELIIRGDLKRCLIVSPGNLAEQWQDELYSKFHLRFEILTNDRLESAVTGNAFTEINYCIARLDKLSRNEEIQQKLAVSDWDLIVCDEAHKMAATMWGGEVRYTKRYQLGRLLSNITRHFLLLTATPHNGKEEDFQLFMSLVDADRFEGACRTSNQSIDVSDVMRRLVKEDLLKFDGTPLFPERIAQTVNYDLSPMEAQLYTNVTTYVQEEFNRADNLEGKQKATVGFALTILQRRLASSPEAIYQSLRRRRERLETRLAEEKLGKRAASMPWQFDIPEDPDDIDDLPSDELEETEEHVADQVSAARTIQELEAEIETLKRLEYMANQVRNSGQDKKWDELSSILQDDPHFKDESGQLQKLIIFTEHRDTLNYLANKIRTLFGKDEAVVTIHGGMLRDDRRKVETLFKQDKDVRILIATDAAGEGINLQRAHLMVNYDLPWNPNRLEQRFGRIHRIGQTEVCYLWNMVSKETREGAVYQKLFDKLEEERAALGGKVFDILGKVTFDNKPLRELLIEAIRYGNLPETKAKLYQVVDRSLDRDALRSLLEERALTEDSMDVHKVMAIKEEMERMKDGTFIKLMNYQMKSFKGPLTLNYFYRLNTLAPQLALPVRIRETRDIYNGKSLATNLYGVIPRLQEKGAEILEEGYPTDFSFTVDGQHFDGLVYLFKPGMEANYRRYREGVLLTLNGQSQAIYPHLFFNDANLSYIRNSLLLIVNCTNVDAKHQNKLFMPSRDRVRDSEFTKEMVEKILSMLKEHPGLKRIANERRANALKDKIANDKPLKDTLRNILSKSPVLSKLFLAGREISAPFNLSGGAGETKKFKGRKHPTFFELSGKVVDGKMTKHVPCNKTFRVKFLTDAENGYFSRLDDPGRFVMKLNGVECDELRDSFSLIDGVVTLCVSLPEGAKPGDRLNITTEIEDDCILNRFESMICVEVGEAEESNAGGSGDRHKPRDEEKKGDQKTPQGFAMPEIKPVRKDEWSLHGMDSHSALVYYPSEAGGDYYLNMDNDYLLAELKSRRVSDYITLTETRYHCCMALIGMSVISYYKTRKKDDQEEQMDVEEAVRKITTMVAPILIPMLDSMAELTVDDVINAA